MTEEGPKTRSDRYYFVLAFRMVADFGIAIAIPALVAAVIGNMLDERFGTEPILLIILLIIAFTATAVYVVRKAYYYQKLYQNGSKND